MNKSINKIHNWESLHDWVQQLKFSHYKEHEVFYKLFQDGVAL